MNGQRTSPSRRPRAGFTLIELLVVILIIAILAGFLLVAVWGAQQTAQDARTLLEIDQMAQALEAYKSQYGEYPPIGTHTNNTQRIRAHIARAFPRYVQDNATITTIDSLTPDQALVFWLGGMPIGTSGALAVEGFSANVANPFQFSSAGAVQRTQAFFNFDPQRLRTPQTGGTPASAANFWIYVPHGKNTPYVYFPADQYVDYTNSPPTVRSYLLTSPGSQMAVPYLGDTSVVNAGGTLVAAATDLPKPTTWVNPKTFQIIAAGQDDLFNDTGALNRVYPQGTGYSQADEDNLTNFSGKRLSKARP